MINKIFNFQFSIFNSAKGMTLFISIVVMSILIFISFAAVNVTLKSTLFSSSGRDSQFAFYAADAGIECAVYWDAKFEPSKFATSTGGSPISCGGLDISTGQAISGTTTLARIGGGGAANPTSVFGFTMDQGANSVPHCVIVMVRKNPNGSTFVNSRGYNTCDTGNPRRIERGVEVSY